MYRRHGYGNTKPDFPGVGMHFMKPRFKQKFTSLCSLQGTDPEARMRRGAQAANGQCAAGPRGPVGKTQSNRHSPEASALQSQRVGHRELAQSTPETSSANFF